VRDSAGEVLPLSQFGGFVIGARAVALRGVPAAEAYASTVVDVTTEMLAQIAFVLVGVVLLVRRIGFHGEGSRLLFPLLVGAAFAMLGAAGFIMVQRRGPAFAESIARRLLPRAVSHAGAFARAIEQIYAQPRRIVLSVCIHFTGWLASAGVSYYAVHLIGSHIGYVQMVAIESALSAIRSAAVVVPSAMGVQEATYAMLMPLFGASPAIGLALSLIKRASNIVIGVPVLLSWQGLESRQAISIETREERLSRN
jgi:putative membrane protein